MLLILLYVPDDPAGAVPEIFENVLFRNQVGNDVYGFHQIKGLLLNVDDQHMDLFLFQLEQDILENIQT